MGELKVRSFTCDDELWERLHVMYVADLGEDADKSFMRRRSRI